MFDTEMVGIGLWPGESPEDLEAEARLAYEVACGALEEDAVEETRHFLPPGLE